MCRPDYVLMLYLVHFAVYAIPLHQREVLNPFDPLKSVVSQIFDIPTALTGSRVAANTIAISSQISPSTASSSVDSSPLSAGSTRGSAVQSSGLSALPSAASTALPESLKQSTTANPQSTGGGRLSSLTSTSPTGSFGATTASSASLRTTSATSRETAVSIVPTTTGNSNPTSSSSSHDPDSQSGSGSDPSSSSVNPHPSGRLSPVETTAAVILPVLALIVILFSLWRYRYRLRRRYTAWRQQRLEGRAYRRALDDPVLAFGTREKVMGLGLGDVEQMMRPLSFGFQRPQRPDIKRKPLTWDATRVGASGLSAIGMAVPMGEHRRTESDSSGGSLDTIYKDVPLNPT